MATFGDYEGNIFASQCEAIVITVNCVGVMGAGIALDAKLRWPDVYEQYRLACDSGDVAIGKCLWIAAGDSGRTAEVVCFPTKQHWRFPSKLSYIRAGAPSLAALLLETGVRSVAMPHLGCSHGGLEWPDVRPIVVSGLEGIPELEVQFWTFVEDGQDDAFLRLVLLVEDLTLPELARRLQIGVKQADALVRALRLSSVRGLASLQRAPGVGEKTLAAVYRFLFGEAGQSQLELPL